MGGGCVLAPASKEEGLLSCPDGVEVWPAKGLDVLIDRCDDRVSIKSFIRAARSVDAVVDDVARSSVGRTLLKSKANRCREEVDGWAVFLCCTGAGAGAKDSGDKHPAAASVLAAAASILAAAASVLACQRRAVEPPRHQRDLSGTQRC